MSQKSSSSLFEGRTFLYYRGNQAQLLHHLMDVFSKQDVFVDCLWEAQWEENSGKNSKPSNGFMMLGHRALLISLRRTIFNIEPALYPHTLL